MNCTLLVPQKRTNSKMLSILAKKSVSVNIGQKLDHKKFIWYAETEVIEVKKNSSGRSSKSARHFRKVDITDKTGLPTEGPK